MGIGMSLGDYRLVVLITEDEMWQKRSESPGAKGVPEFYCITKNDGVQFFPAIDPTRCALMCKEGLI